MDAEKYVRYIKVKNCFALFYHLNHENSKLCGCVCPNSSCSNFCLCPQQNAEGENAGRRRAQTVNVHACQFR